MAEKTRKYYQVTVGIVVPQNTNIKVRPLTGIVSCFNQKEALSLAIERLTKAVKLEDPVLEFKLVIKKITLIKSDFCVFQSDK